MALAASADLPVGTGEWADVLSLRWRELREKLKDHNSRSVCRPCLAELPGVLETIQADFWTKLPALFTYRVGMNSLV